MGAIRSGSSTYLVDDRFVGKELDVKGLGRRFSDVGEAVAKEKHRASESFSSSRIIIVQQAHQHARREAINVGTDGYSQ